MNNIPYIDIVADTNFEFGLKLGKALKEQIKKRVNDNKKIYTKVTNKSFDELVNKAENYIKPILEDFPYVFEELMGLSDGSNIPVNHLVTLMCEEEILYSPIPRCTSFAVRIANNDVLIGHNEDWIPDYQKNGMYIVKGEIKNQNKFLSLSYIGTLPGASCSLNDSGLAYTGNSIRFLRYRYGIPKMVLNRVLLNCSSIKEAERIIDKTTRSISSNTLLVWKNERIEDIEFFWKNEESWKNHNLVVHTNNPVDPAMQNDLNTDKESLDRYYKVIELIKNKKSLDVEAVKSILSDHQSGICGHIDKKHPNYGVTIASAIMDPKAKWMLVCSTTPCDHKYVRYEL